MIVQCYIIHISDIIQAKQKKFSSLDAEFNAADAQKAELLKKER